MKDQTLRRAAAVALALTGVIHLVLAPEYMAEQAYIGEDAQFEAEFVLFTLFALCALARRAIGR